MRIVAIPATNTRRGLNRQLLDAAARLLDETISPGVEVDVVDLNDLEMPIFSVERERQGIPEAAQRFLDAIGAADAVMVSFAEYNGSYTPAWKNTFDWATRIDRAVYQNKPVAMFAATPGPRGGAGVLASATTLAPYFGADLVGSLGVARFPDVFDAQTGRLTDPDLQEQFEKVLTALVAGQP